MTREVPLLHADRFDVVAVRIDQERSVIVRAVIGAQAGTAVVASTGLQAIGVEAIDLRATHCPQCDMRPGRLFTRRSVEPQRGCAARTQTGAGVVARRQLVAERTERRGVETHARVDVLNLQTD